MREDLKKRLAPMSSPNMKPAKPDSARAGAAQVQNSGADSVPVAYQLRALGRLQIARFAVAAVLVSALCAATLSTAQSDRNDLEVTDVRATSPSDGGALRGSQPLRSVAATDRAARSDTRSSPPDSSQTRRARGVGFDSVPESSVHRTYPDTIWQFWPGLPILREPSRTQLQSGRALGGRQETPELRSYNGRPIRPVRIERMRVTAYSPDERSCGESADGITASGYSVSTNGGFLVAADPTVLPLGSLVSVPGYDFGDVVPVLDVGGAIKGARLDVLFPTHEQAMHWGVQMLDVTVWEYSDGKPNDFKRFRRPQR
jgi:3D (Asp-Asp-Asp) domain-containing protein